MAEVKIYDEIHISSFKYLAQYQIAAPETVEC